MIPELPKSKLPQDSEYWEELAQRIRRDAAAPLADYAASHNAWYNLLANRAGWWVGAASAALVILWLALPATPSRDSVWIEGWVAPDDVAGRMLAAAHPPSVEELMAQFPPPRNEGRIH